MPTHNGVACCSTSQPLFAAQIACEIIHHWCAIPVVEVTKISSFRGRINPCQTMITKPSDVRLFKYCYALPYMAPQPDARERLAKNRPLRPQKSTLSLKNELACGMGHCVARNKNQEHRSLSNKRSSKDILQLTHPCCNSSSSSWMRDQKMTA